MSRSRKALVIGLCVSTLSVGFWLLYEKQWTPRARAERFAQRLGPDSVKVMPRGFASAPVAQGDAVRQLVGIGGPATNALLRRLRDPDAAAAAHLVLIAIWNPQHSEVVEEILRDETEEISGFRYDILGLSIVSMESEDYVARADPESIGDALKQWCVLLPEPFKGAACAERTQ